MSNALQAVLFGFSGVILDDEPIQAEVINRLLLSANLRPLNLKDPTFYRDEYLGRGDVERLRAIWSDQGRVLKPDPLELLLRQKREIYVEIMAQQLELPIIPDLHQTLLEFQRRGSRLGLVTGVNGGEVDYVLDRLNLRSLFTVVVTGSDQPQDPGLSPSYLHELALARLEIPATDCLGIEASYPGIAALKTAGITALAIATQFPLQMLQRRANWAIDRYVQLNLKLPNNDQLMEWDRIYHWFEARQDRIGYSDGSYCK